MNSKNISMSDQIDQENCDNPSMMEKNHWTEKLLNVTSCQKKKQKLFSFIPCLDSYYYLPIDTSNLWCSKVNSESLCQTPSN